VLLIPSQPAPDDRNSPPQPAGAAQAEGVTCSLCPSQVLTAFHRFSHRIRAVRSGAERCVMMAYLSKPSAATPAEEQGECQAEPGQRKRRAAFPLRLGSSPASQSGLKGKGAGSTDGANCPVMGHNGSAAYAVSLVYLCHPPQRDTLSRLQARDPHPRNDHTASSAPEHWHAVCTTMGSVMARRAARRRCFSRKAPPLGLLVPRRLPHQSTFPSMTTELWQTAKGRKR
jgi:hypothetical protein